MTHRTLNGLITGLAVFYLGLIIAGVLFGTNGNAEDDPVTPGSDDIVTEARTPHTGVGGVGADEWTAAGIVLDAESDEPLPGVSVVAQDDGAAQVTTTTDPDGRFELDDIPPTAVLEFNLDGYYPAEHPANGGEEYVVSLEPSAITGRVVSTTGNAIRAATVAIGDNFTRTGDQGEFRLDDPPQDGHVIAKAAGYETSVIPHAEFQTGFTLTPKSIRGIYVSADTVADEHRFAAILDMIDRTELNALVVDIKGNSGHIHYDSQIPMAREIGAVQPMYDAGEVLQQIKDRDVYAIARIAVFADPVLADARPDLAIRNHETGDLWESAQEQQWANPYRSEVQDYNVELMREVIEIGFDEIQFSYVQFPDDGPVEQADYGQESTAETRQQAINDFLDYAYTVIGPTPASLSGDILAMTVWGESDDETGQGLVAMAERLDYVNPILFPSSFARGSLGLEVPDDHPYWMVSRSLESSMDLLPGDHHPRVRPWLQDFSADSGIRYGEAEVRKQIDAAKGHGLSGWMLWNPDNYYHEAALDQSD